MKEYRMNEIFGEIDAKYVAEAAEATGIGVSAGNKIIGENKRKRLPMKKMTKVLIAAAVCLAVVAGSFTVGAAVMKRYRTDEIRELYHFPIENYTDGNETVELSLLKNGVLSGAIAEWNRSVKEFIKEHDVESDLSQTLNYSYADHTHNGMYVGELGDIISKYPNMKLKDLPEKPFLQFSSMAGYDYINPQTYVGPSMLHMHEEGLNINYIEKLDEDHVAVIYRFYDDENISDYDPHYVAMVFYREIYETSRGDGSMREGWVCPNEMYIIDEIHSSDEYSNIRNGDKVGSLYVIDPSIKFDVRVHFKKPGENIAIFHKILSDGILVVEYEYDQSYQYPSSIEGDPDRIITSIEFYPFSEGRLSESLKRSYKNYTVSVNDASIMDFLK